MQGLGPFSCCCCLSHHTLQQQKFFTLDISLAWKGAMFPSVAAVLEFTLVSKTFAFDGGNYLQLATFIFVASIVGLFLTKASFVIQYGLYHLLVRKWIESTSDPIHHITKPTQSISIRFWRVASRRRMRLESTLDFLFFHHRSKSFQKGLLGNLSFPQI